MISCCRRYVIFSVTLLLLLIICQGCASLSNDEHTGVAKPVEIEEAPFYPQQKFQCGPASLAMLLGASGVFVHPDELSGKIYLPGREGSLQLELIAAARTYGRIPYMIDNALPALIDEIKAGRPVLVLQNLGIELIPVYHYAVVVGVLPNDKVILRSGTDKRLIMDVDDFLETWNRAGAWGIILLQPGALPENGDPLKYLKAVNSFEIVGNAHAATKAYEAAISSWPQNQTFLFALGNNYLLMEKHDQAEMIFRKLLEINPEHVGALNNLAEIFLQKGCLTQASNVIDKTVEIAQSTNSSFKEVVLLTQREILQQISSSDHGDRNNCQGYP